MSTKSSGLYHPYFTEEEIRDLEGIPHDDLTGEIHLQRYLLILVMSKSPPAPLEFDLLLEKNRACNTAIRSLITLIYAETEIRRNRRPEWEILFDAAHLMSAEQLGIVDDVFPADEAAAIRAENPYYQRQAEMEATFDPPDDQPLPSESSPLPQGRVPDRVEGPGVREDGSAPQKYPDVKRDNLPGKHPGSDVIAKEPSH